MHHQFGENKNPFYIKVATFLRGLAFYTPVVPIYFLDKGVSLSLIRNVGNTISKVLLGLSLTGFGVSGMVRIQAAYLVFGSFISYWLLVKCGCVYKLHEDTPPRIGKSTSSKQNWNGTETKATV